MSVSTTRHVIVLGESNCGKSELVRKICGTPFLGESSPTLGIASQECVVKISGGSRAAIRLWDTSATASSTDLARALLPSMNSAIFVFDCTNVNSFEQLKTWITFADTAMAEAAMKSRIVVCSKTDLRVKKAVDRQSARDFCRRVGCTYIEQCSNSSEGRDKLLEILSSSLGLALEQE